MKASHFDIALSANNIHVHFGDTCVVDDVSLAVNKGQVTALLGPNGAGKSTLLKALAGELVCKGEVEIFSAPRRHWKKDDLARHLSMLPQSSSLSFPFLAQEVVELGAIPLNKPAREITQLARINMRKAGVEHLAQRLYPSLSGGEKQRLHLARILTQLSEAGDKQILLLDEPTSALDLSHQHNSLNLARNIAHDENAAVIVVLHDLNLAAQYADRMLVLKQGQIAYDGTPEHVMTASMIDDVYGYKATIATHPSLGFPMMYSS